MSHWLFKTEPTHYSFTDLERDGKAVWDGVSNNLALKHLRRIQKGDETFIYHSGDEKQIAGIAVAISNPYPDPNAYDPKLAVVEIKPKCRLKNPVTLTAIKVDKKLQKFDLLRLPRLSVMPVSEEQWERLTEMAEKQA